MSPAVGGVRGHQTGSAPILLKQLNKLLSVTLFNYLHVVKEGAERDSERSSTKTDSLTGAVALQHRDDQRCIVFHKIDNEKKSTTLDKRERGTQDLCTLKIQLHKEYTEK